MRAPFYRRRTPLRRRWAAHFGTGSVTPPSTRNGLQLLRAFIVEDAHLHKNKPKTKQKPAKNATATQKVAAGPYWLCRRRACVRGLVASTSKAPPVRFFDDEEKNRYVEVPGCSPPSALKAGLHLHCGVPPTKKKNTSYVGDGGLLRRRCMIREAAFVKTKVPHSNSS